MDTKPDKEKQSNQFSDLASATIPDQYFKYQRTLWLYLRSPKALARAITARDWDNIQKPLLFASIGAGFATLALLYVNDPLAQEHFTARTKLSIGLAGMLALLTFHAICAYPRAFTMPRLVSSLFVLLYWLGAFLPFYSIVRAVEGFFELQHVVWPVFIALPVAIALSFPILVSPVLTFAHIYERTFDRALLAAVLAFTAAALLFFILPF